MAVYFDYNLYETEKYSRLHSILECTPCTSSFRMAKIDEVLIVLLLQ